MPGENVSGFFDNLSRDYTGTIERCFPRYREMLWALLEYLPESLNGRSILELGCGTGNLSVLLRGAFPNARLCLVDVSVDSLRVCQERIAAGDTVFEERDFRELDYAAGSFDLVVSSISVHHLSATEKRDLFRRINEWLVPNGLFTFADQCRGETDELYKKHIEHWKSLSIAAGSTETEFAMWMQHQAEHDFHDSLMDQMAWLRDAGFADVDCVWRYLLWCVIQARKV